MSKWQSPSWTEKIDNVIQLNDGSIQIGIDFNTIDWSTVKKAGFKLREQIAGFDKEYGHLLWYPNNNYDMPVMHMFMRLWGKVDITWHSAFITDNSISKIPFYEEKNIEYNHAGETVTGISKELGWSGSLSILGFDFLIYLGQAATVFSEQFQLKTKVTTPLNLNDVGLEYLFILSPEIVEVQKKIKYVRIMVDTGDVDEHLRPIYEHQDISFKKLVDKSGDLPIMLKKISFILTSGKEITFFDFEDIFKQAHESFWEIKHVTLPSGQTTYALSIRSNFGVLSMGQTLEIDPTWTAPSAIHSDCGATDTDKLIDGNTTTFAFCVGMHLHYVVFDMGQSYSISGVRCFTNYIIQAHRIYVSEDTSFSEAEIVSTDHCFPDANKDWTEKTFSAKTGRYIKFELYRTRECTTSNYVWYGPDFYEFEAYCATPPSGTPQSHGYIF